MELRTAAIWRRLGAGVLDLLLGLAIWGVAAMWLVIGAWSGRAPRFAVEDALVLVGAIIALGMLLHVVYHVVFVGGCGQTPGRMAAGIFVVTRDGARPGLGRALLRCLGTGLSFLTLGAGFLGVLFTREGRGLADWLAGTRVVRGAAVPDSATDRGSRPPILTS